MCLFNLFIGLTFLLSTPYSGSQPSPRIQVRPGIEAGEFYYTQDGISHLFEPRGNSWVMLHEQPNGHGSHANFSPEIYDSITTEQVLTEMEQGGYNVVRVFTFRGYGPTSGITGVGGPSDKITPDLDSGYMANFLDFLERARNHSIHVQVVIDGWPGTEYYANIARVDLPLIQGINRYLMTPGNIAATAEFLQRFVQTVVDSKLESTIFSYEIPNEPCYYTDALPFSTTNGNYETAAGTYDMGSAVSRQACADNNAILALSTWYDAVKNVDPNALTHTSLFSFYPVGKSGMATNGLLPLGTSDVRWPLRMKYVYDCADFGDLHMYIAEGTTVTQHLKGQEWSVIPDKNIKPFIAGEFGALRTAYSNDHAAATALLDWRQNILDAGFAGAELFTWDTLTHIRWTATEGDGAVNAALMPEATTVSEIYLTLTNTAKTIALWHMDAISGPDSNRVEDASGNGNHLWLGGGSGISSNGLFSGSLRLDGTNDFGINSSLWQPYDSFQIDLWVKPEASTSEYYLIDVKDVFHLSIKNNTIRFDVRQTTGTWVSCASISNFIKNHQLEHIRAVCSNGKAQLILSNGSVNEKPFSGIPPQVIRPLYIGSQSGTNLFYQGTIDEVRINANRQGQLF